jgi:hypothetical protein
LLSVLVQRKSKTALKISLKEKDIFIVGIWQWLPLLMELEK